MVKWTYEDFFDYWKCPCTGFLFFFLLWIACQWLIFFFWSHPLKMVDLPQVYWTQNGSCSHNTSHFTVFSSGSLVQWCKFSWDLRLHLTSRYSFPFQLVRLAGHGGITSFPILDCRESIWTWWPVLVDEHAAVITMGTLYLDWTKIVVTDNFCAHYIQD